MAYRSIRGWDVMRLLWKFAFGIAIATCSMRVARSQDLAPRAYIITPLRSNAAIISYAYFNGSVLINGAAPITGATGTYNVQIATYYHGFNFFGRSANAALSLPYGIGTFQGDVAGTHEQVYRSGLLDLNGRLSVNLKGGPAMTLREMMKWKQKTLLGVSLRVVAPTGQYDPDKLVNWGANRWGFKPEFGYSERWDHWVLDGYAGAWFFTTNPEYYSHPAPAPQTQRPIASFESHLSYDLKPRLWVSLDGNFWYGGIVSVNGVENTATRQLGSRLGATASVPITKHGSLKFGYNNADYSQFGGAYQNVSVAWQYSWLGHPK
ncbi:MAG: transporter [Acidobacteriaceae bacterium]